jgi:tRNA(Ser,Leu) C12 N-acetylase TAN1
MSFLISSKRSFERDALSEAYYVISDVLKYEVKPLKSRVPGLAILTLVDNETSTDEIIVKIRKYIEKEGPLIACLKIVPLEKLIKTDLLKIIDNIHVLAKEKILPLNTWKICVRKRQTTLRSSQVIEKVAEKINWGKVNLTDPDFEIRIEIVRDLTGITIMKPNFEISMSKYLIEDI